jgi:predicted O-linked N-acetylglucosamine transferase (SPINDLY family)
MKFLDLSRLILKSEAECAQGIAIDSFTLDFLVNFTQAVSENGYPFETQDAALGGDEVELCLLQVAKLVDQNLFATAEILLLGILNCNPMSEEAMLALANINEKNNDYAKTVEYACALAPKALYNNEIGYQHAFALHRLGRQDEAIEIILPSLVCANSTRIARLYGLILKSFGQLADAIQVLEGVIKDSPSDIYSIRALSEIYSEIGMYQKSFEVLDTIPPKIMEEGDKLGRSLLYRLMGELDLAIQTNADAIREFPQCSNALWTQCFNYSISSSGYVGDLLATSQKFWSMKRNEQPATRQTILDFANRQKKKLKIAILSSDIGEHVVSRFLAPILRCYDRKKYHISLLSTHRRFEDMASRLVEYADSAISLNELSGDDLLQCFDHIQADVIIETNGFTRNSGIALLMNRLAPVQCHYIGYHATTGLDTVDYFLGDSVTAPEELQYQYTEKLVQIPTLWMGYDSTIEFPPASSTAQRESPVLGSFSQISKINSCTLKYWAAALNSVPNSILVIKDRGCHCPVSCRRIKDTLESMGIDKARIYLFGPVASHFDHLDAYNAIDIALDTTPWSSATTAYEALGMGVPLVAICGDTTSGRMSTSVVTAAGLGNLVAHSQAEFAQIVAKLSKDYRQIRKDKRAMQGRIRSGILFDEQRICKDFFATIDSLVANHA